MGVRRYSARELATSLGLHIRTIERECNRGNLEGYRTPSGRYHLIPEPALNAWLETHGKTVLARSLSRWPESRSRIPRSSNQPDTDTTDDE